MGKKLTNSRLGLCLSGGGFRASFFHIGTLARMAENGMLRHVEVISTVSGGSIVGAAYYLKLKQLLETKPDLEIVEQDYLDIVASLEQHFLETTQKNLRLRLFADIPRNIKMSFSHYSRSDAMGEIYDKYIYRDLMTDPTKPIYMRDLLIQPAHHVGKFHPLVPESGNNKRKNKVPILIINATSLNSGHNWSFTATKMGEIPPRNRDMRDLDKKDRYRRVRYDEIDASKRPKDILLGKAVAASASVPGLLPPLSISRLYKDRTIQLVDGGVYDNQGVTGLLDPAHTCANFIVSDAVGQSEAINNPSTKFIGVLTQASNILMGRVREESVKNLLDSFGEKHTAYFHLKRGLFARDIEFNEQENKQAPGRYMKADILSAKKDYGLSDNMQEALSEMRTDLDAFSNPEARALQADAYLMCEKELKKLPKRYHNDKKLTRHWAFQQYIPMLKTNSDQLYQHIKIGRARFFRPYRLMKIAKFNKSMGLLAVSIPLFLCIGLYIYLATLGITTLLTNKTFIDATVADVIPGFGITLFWIVAFVIMEKYVHRLAHGLQYVRSIFRAPVFFIMHFVVPVLLYPPIIIYLHTINWYYINIIGELDVVEIGVQPGSGMHATTGGL